MDVWGWVAIGASVAAVALLVAGILLRWRNSLDRGRAVARRSGEIDPGAGSGDPASDPSLVLGDMTDVLARGLPGSDRDQEQIQPELERAGFYGTNVLTEYRAVRAVLVLIPLFVAGAIALLVPPAMIVYVAVGGLFLSVLGFALPRLYVTLRASARSRQIERGLPVFADMLSIALLAGQGLTGALKRVTGQLREAFPLMAEELEIVIRQTELLNLQAAFEQWARRSQSAEVRNMALLLGQAQQLGNDVTTALMEYATHLRSDSRQKADARAQRASFWMLFPTILCLWIPAGIVLVGPAYFEFAQRRTKAREEIQSVAPDSPFGKVLRGEPPTNGKQ